jgi:hypothetical protein
MHTDRPAYSRPGDDASPVCATHAVAKSRTEIIKRWTKLIHINPSVRGPTNRNRCWWLVQITAMNR